MLRFALTIFLSAFLLFQVQPLIGKYILPWFGGTNNVWTTCLLFFQVVLLAGYAYAHLLSKLSWKKQATVHLVLLALTLPFLPIAPSEMWKPGPENEPTLRILLLLAATIGLPYLVLSTTGPLLQNWFSAANPGKSPYRLYALSNVGSLLALITFPIVWETNFTRWQQVLFWSIGFGGFVLCCAWCALQLRAQGATLRSDAPALAADNPRDDVHEPIFDAPPAPSPFTVMLWLALAAAGSAILLATTNQLTGDVAVVPFLWVIPLALYLVTFIICFDNDWWYIRPLFGGLLLASIPVGIFLLFEGVDAPLMLQIIGYSTLMFACCMTCHGELARSRPHPKYLTLFYLTISAGGAAGGFFVAVVAPQSFAHFYEYHWAVFACVLVTFLAWGRDLFVRPARKHAPIIGYLVAMNVAALCVIVVYQIAEEPIRNWYVRDTAAEQKIIAAGGEKKEVWVGRPVAELWSVFLHGERTDASKDDWTTANTKDNGLVDYWRQLGTDRVKPEGFYEKTQRDVNHAMKEAGLTEPFTIPEAATWAQLVRTVVTILFVGAALLLVLDEFLARRGKRPVLWMAGPTIAAVALAWSLLNHAAAEREDVIYTTRNFYGVLHVEKHLDPTRAKQDEWWQRWTDDDGVEHHEDIGPKLKLVHGRIMHGFQFLHELPSDGVPVARYWSTSYYGRKSGVGMAIDHHPRRVTGTGSERNLHIGVIGLGTGTLATYGEKGDKVSIYEINPAVPRIAREYFTYLKDAEDRGANVTIVLGDARIQMERERDRGEKQLFDVLAVDAFSSDAIPIHLLTKEACELYFEHLKPDGILALHISNRFIDLEPVTYALAKDVVHCRPLLFSSGDEGPGVSSSTWVLLTKNEAFHADEDVLKEADMWKVDPLVTPDNVADLRSIKQEYEKLEVGDKNPKYPKLVLWTDDFAALWGLLE